MRRRVVVVVAVAGWLATATWTVLQARQAQAPAPAQGPAAAAAPTAAQQQALIDKYCVGCHNDRQKVGGLSLQIPIADAGAHADVWEKAIRKIQARMMPPAGMPRPDGPTLDQMVSFLETSLDRAQGDPYPGRPLLHRLNRTRYANAIRDLLDLKVDATTLLPADNAAYGFDNNADSLGVSPVLMERYLSAAGQIAALAVGDMSMAMGAETFRIRQDLSQHSHIEGTPLGTVGGLATDLMVPLDAEYLIKIKLIRTNMNVTRGLENERELEISVDGQRVKVVKFGGPADNKASFENPTKAAEEIDGRMQARVPLRAGPRKLAVAFIKRSDAQTSFRLQPFLRSSFDSSDITGMPQVEFVSVTGPFSPTGPGDTPSRRRVFICQPTRPADEMACATRIVTTLARRAYRRQPTATEVTSLMDFYRRGRAEGSFDTGITMALNRMLASPNFTFREEALPQGLQSGAAYRISDPELASRLSFFLWNSIPDELLLTAAERGNLRSPRVLRQQVGRMLADPRASLVSDFAAQWLGLRGLNSVVPNSDIYPDFDDNLRKAMARETEMVFETIIREDRSVLDLINSDYTFVNERLAKHYGMSNIYGEWFRRVPVTRPERRGLLGHASILTVTSHSDRTSPVNRGKWVLENLFGAVVPPPPPSVPPLRERERDDAPRTMRDRMIEHRRSPACASCHSVLDPVGLSLENYDAVGAWRTHEDGGERGPIIDATGSIGGRDVNGVVELRQALLQRPEQVARAFTEKFMIYALGRGLDHRDMPTVRAIVRAAKANDYKFSSILYGIIESRAFQMAIVPDYETVTAPAGAGRAPALAAAR